MLEKVTPGKSGTLAKVYMNNLPVGTELATVTISLDEWYNYKLYFNSGETNYITLALISMIIDSQVDNLKLKEVDELPNSGPVPDVQKVDFDTFPTGMNSYYSWNRDTSNTRNGSIGSVYFDGMSIPASEHTEYRLPIRLDSYTTYEISLWVKADKANGKSAQIWGPPTQSVGLYLKLNTASDWTEMKTTFTTGNVDGEVANICLVGYGDCSYYADDLTITKIARTLPYCEEAYNLVPDGSFEKYLGRSGWTDLPEFLSINSTADEKGAASGRYYMTYNEKNGGKYVVPVVIPKGGRYVFAASMKKLTDGNSKIWLASDKEGTPYSKLASGYTSAAFTPESTDKYTRYSVDFNVDKANTTVYVVFEDNGGSYQVDDIQIFRKALGREENPNNWDIISFDYDSLLPVVDTVVPDTETDNTESDEELDSDITDDEETDVSKEETDSSKDDVENNTNTDNKDDTEEGGFNWIIVIIIAGAVLLATIAVVIILVVKRRRANHEA